MRQHRFTAVAIATLLLLLTGRARAQQLPAGSAGPYALASVEGHTLPYAPGEPGRPPEAGTLEILCSTLIVTPDGHFRMAMTYRLTRGGQTRIFDSPFTGTVEKDRTGYVMEWDEAGLTPVKLEGDSLSLQNEGQWYTYRRSGRPRPGN